MRRGKPDAATLLARAAKVLDHVLDRITYQANGINVKRLRGNIRSWLKENAAAPDTPPDEAKCHGACGGDIDTPCSTGCDYREDAATPPDEARGEYCALCDVTHPIPCVTPTPASPVRETCPACGSPDRNNPWSRCHARITPNPFHDAPAKGHEGKDAS